MTAIALRRPIPLFALAALPTLAFADDAAGPLRFNASQLQSAARASFFASGSVADEAAQLRQAALQAYLWR